MKTLVLVSVAMFALSVCAVEKVGFCIGKDTKGKLGYVQGDYNNMKDKSKDTTLDKCVQSRYSTMSDYVSTVLNKTCTDVREVVKSYCKDGKVTGNYTKETFNYKDKPYKDALVLYKNTTKCTATTDSTDKNVNNPGDRWFFAKEECSTVDLSL